MHRHFSESIDFFCLFIFIIRNFLFLISFFKLLSAEQGNGNSNPSGRKHGDYNLNFLFMTNNQNNETVPCSIINL